MNQETVKGNWNSLKGKIKSKWSKLTDDDLKAVEASFDDLKGRVQKVYGLTKEKAEEEFSEFKKTSSNLLGPCQDNHAKGSENPSYSNKGSSFRNDPAQSSTQQTPGAKSSQAPKRSAP